MFKRILKIDGPLGFDHYLDIIVLAMWILTPWALLFSKAVLSILVAVLAVCIVVKTIRTKADLEWKSIGPYFALYALVLVSGFWTRNTGQWFHLLNVSIPYLVFPISFVQHRQYLRTRKDSIFHQFLWASMGLLLYVVYSYFAMGQELIDKVLSGQAFPLPTNHIRTSLILAVTLIWTLDQWMRQNNQSLEGIKYGIGTGLLFVMLHILAIRSGLAIGYIGIGMYLIWQWKEWKHYRIAVLVSLIGVGILAISLFPPLQAKWQYWLEDLANYDGYAWNFYSDAVRFKTMVMGWEIGLQYPILGIGLGDVLDEMTLLFQVNDNLYLRKVIHNMFLTWWAGTGIVGLSIALYSLYIIGKSVLCSKVYSTVFAMIMVSCLVENTLQVYAGEILFIMFSIFAKEE